MMMSSDGIKNGFNPIGSGGIPTNGGGKKGTELSDEDKRFLSSDENKQVLKSGFIVANLQDEQFRFGTVTASAVTGAGISAFWDIGESSLRANKFHVESWKNVGKTAGLFAAGSLLFGSGLELWRANEAKKNNAFTRKAMDF